jgi:hypothetical protein
VPHLQVCSTCSFHVRARFWHLWRFFAWRSRKTRFFLFGWDVRQLCIKTYLTGEGGFPSQVWKSPSFEKQDSLVSRAL